MHVARLWNAVRVLVVLPFVRVRGGRGCRDKKSTFSRLINTKKLAQGLAFTARIEPWAAKGHIHTYSIVCMYDNIARMLRTGLQKLKRKPNRFAPYSVHVSEVKTSAVLLLLLLLFPKGR